MHRDHDHDHDRWPPPRPLSTVSHGHTTDQGITCRPGPQPRATRRVAWPSGRRPHLDPHDAEPHAHGEADLDQVEAAFVEGFLAASDPTSFLRLAGIPFTATAADGAKLVLLRVETEVVADVGSVTPHLGGGSFRYDPLPQALVSRRRRLRFVYFDGAGPRHLTFADVREEPGRGA